MKILHGCLLFGIKEVMLIISKNKQRTLYFLDSEWELIQLVASERKIGASEVIRRCSLNLLQDPNCIFYLVNGVRLNTDIKEHILRQELLTKVDKMIDILIHQGIDIEAIDCAWNLEEKQKFKLKDKLRNVTGESLRKRLASFSDKQWNLLSDMTKLFDVEIAPFVRYCTMSILMNPGMTFLPEGYLFEPEPYRVSLHHKFFINIDRVLAFLNESGIINKVSTNE